MGTMKRHPLYAKADALKSAFILNGFALHDNGLAPEVGAADWAFRSFQKPEELKMQPILLGDGDFALRSELITAELVKIKSPLPIKAIAAGRVYDAKDEACPCHTAIEGVFASKVSTFKDYTKLWTDIVRQVYGFEASASLTALSASTYRVEVTAAENTFTLACTGAASDIARALLGIEDAQITVWVFSIDVDAVAMHDYGLKDRAALYNPNVSFLSEYESSSPAIGDTFANKASNILRKMGFLEFSGLKIYEADCYQKMHMIQENWDKNNEGVYLTNPLGKYTWIPTVLTPALEEALSVNYKAGEESARIFEIGHIFLPNPKGGAPIEKISISGGAYGPDLDKVSFRKMMDAFLTELGISNHFFIPTNLAIAYNTSDCWLILDEKMSYLGGNFGSISPQALKNHEIGVPAYMLQLELLPLEEKAAAEYAFTPPELT